jgi:hypothetical protein
MDRAIDMDAEVNTTDLNFIEREIKILIHKFAAHRTSQPNLAQCWIKCLHTYLELKKRHYAKYSFAELKTQCHYVLNQLEMGYRDFSPKELVSLILYKQIMI